MAYCITRTAKSVTASPVHLVCFPSSLETNGIQTHKRLKTTLFIRTTHSMRNKRFAQNLVRCFLQNRFQASADLIYKTELVYVISLELAENRQFCSNSWADELSVCVKRMWPVFLNVRRPGVLAYWLMYWLTGRKTPNYSYYTIRSRRWGLWDGVYVVMMLVVVVGGGGRSINNMAISVQMSHQFVWFWTVQTLTRYAL